MSLKRFTTASCLAIALVQSPTPQAQALDCPSLEHLQAPASMSKAERQTWQARIAAIADAANDYTPPPDSDRLLAPSPDNTPALSPADELAGPGAEMQHLEAAIDLLRPLEGLDGIDRARRLTREAQYRLVGLTASPGCTLHALAAAAAQLEASVGLLPRRQRPVAQAVIDHYVELATDLAGRLIDRFVDQRTPTAWDEQVMADWQAASVLLERGAAVAALDALSKVSGNIHGTIAFDMDSFEQALRQEASVAMAGYSYAISVGGSLVRQDGEGWARTPTDGASPMQATRAMNVASTGKVLTSIAAQKLLDVRGVNVEWAIGPWLPSSWSRGAGVEDIRFSELMRHVSGLAGSIQMSHDSWSDLEIAVAQPTGMKTWQYENANLGLFRALIPNLLIDNDSINHGMLAAIMYASWVDSSVLAPAGVNTALCDDPSDSPTLYYPWPYVGQGGSERGNELHLCGGGGWYLSSRDWVKVLSALRYGNLLSPARRNELYVKGLGADNMSGVLGVYYGKGGSFSFDNGRGVRTCIMDFPTGLQVSLSVNANNALVGCGPIIAAYDSAWYVK